MKLLRKIYIAVIIIAIVSLTACSNDQADEKMSLEKDLIIEAQAIEIEQLNTQINYLNENIQLLSDEVESLLSQNEEKESQYQSEQLKLQKTVDDLLENMPREGDLKEIPFVIQEKVYDLTNDFLKEDQVRNPDYGYVNFRVEKIDHAYTYEDLWKKPLELYRFHYKYKSLTPENILMAGPMYLDDMNWVEVTYPNSHYLIYSEGEFLLHWMINDAQPGSEIFTEDLSKLLEKEL